MVFTCREIDVSILAEIPIAIAKSSSEKASKRNHVYTLPRNVYLSLLNSSGMRIGHSGQSCLPPARFALHVELSIATSETAVTLLVSDTGPGIAISERERVLDPLYRIPGNDQPGSGLGLSIVKTICDRIGASIALSAGNEASQSGLAVPSGCLGRTPQRRFTPREPLRRGVRRRTCIPQFRLSQLLYPAPATSKFSEWKERNQYREVESAKH